MSMPIMFLDIAGPDPASLRSFYSRVFGWETAKLAEISSMGGSIDAPRFEIPGVVVLGLFRDPAGNPMGLVEIEAGRPKIP